jgi:septum formation protein
VPFEVRPAGIEELTEGPPLEVALENAYRKAAAVAADVGDRVVLGVDTLVALGPRIYGKPAGEAEARATLEALAGRRHLVVSGVCAIAPGEPPQTAAATTTVAFRALDRGRLERYLASGEWRERAGGYAIQGRGAVLVEGIEGDYFNVVGLPIGPLLDLLPGLVG